MNNPALLVTGLFAVLTLFSNIIILTLIVFLLFGKKTALANFLFDTIEKYPIALSFLIASMATVGSLFFSEIARFAPCKLCWIQRIFMFPQVIILLIALITNDLKVKKYVILLSVIGLLFSIYQYILQMFPGVLQCSDELISCSRKYTAYFGYITIPAMSATAFLLIIIFNLLHKTASHQKQE